MTKAELKAELLKGKTLEEAFPYKKDGQDCYIFKTESLQNPDDIVYIPDLDLNVIPYDKPNLNESIEIPYVLAECYTTADFLTEAYGNRKCAEELFSFVDWQHLDIGDLRDCTDNDDAKRYYGETWDEMKERFLVDNISKA